MRIGDINLVTKALGLCLEDVVLVDRDVYYLSILAEVLVPLQCLHLSYAGRDADHVGYVLLQDPHLTKSLDVQGLHMLRLISFLRIGLHHILLLLLFCFSYLLALEAFLGDHFDLLGRCEGRERYGFELVTWS